MKPQEVVDTALPFLLNLRHASINDEIHAGNVRTFIGGEEHDGSRYFLRLPLRPSGTCETNWSAACLACSGLRPAFFQACLCW
jgi:hypothetical protein